MSELTAKVAAVLDDRRLVINVGSAAGVAEGDSVFLWTVTEITDPDTNEPLGSVKSAKLRLTIDEVLEKMSVASVPAPVINFNQVFFKPPPGKRLATRGQAATGDLVRVAVGEEVTVRPAPDGETAAP